MERAKLVDAQPLKTRHFIKRNHKPSKRDETVEFPIFVSTNVIVISNPANPLTAQPGPFGTNGTSLAFTGATLADCASYPPDTMGAAGPTQFIVAVNGRIRSFNKATGQADGVLNSSMDSFFNSVMTPPVNNNFTSDPRIRYDRISKRWFVIIIDVPGQTGTTPNRVLLAVSDGSVITPGTIWSFYYFQHDLVSPAGDTSDFADYPTLGIDANALNIGVNQFLSSGSFDNTTAFVVRKSSLLSGGPIVVTAFRRLISNSGLGPYTPQGVDNFDPAATEGYFIGVDSVSSTRLRLRRISNPGGTPTISGNVSITVSSFAAPITVPHLGNTGGSGGELDGLDERLLAAHFRNGFIWTAHNVGVNSGGGTSSVTRNGVRWYQLKGIATGSTAGVEQFGTLYDSSTTNRFYWMGTIMVSGQGHALLGFSSASTNEHVNAGIAGRLGSTANGTLGTPTLYTASSTAYNAPYNRWGDYSFTSLDPNDDMTLWTIQEYCNANNSYGVQIAKVLAPSPVTPMTCSPSSVSQNILSTNLTISGNSVSGSGFFDPGASFSNRLTAAVGGTGVTVNSVNYVNPTNITLNITVAANATPGLRTIVVTNPDGQSASNSLLTITSTIPITNNPPTLTAISNRTIVELSAFIFTNSASDPDSNVLAFSMFAPAGAVLNTNTGVFSWTPTEAQGPSTNNISIVVTDNGSPSLSATQSFTLFVLETNSAPVLTAISNRTVIELNTLTFTNTANDSDVPTNLLTFSLDAGAPTNAVINPTNGVFTWTPSETQAPSTNNISVVVTDNGTPPLSATQSFTVIVLESNLPPVLAAISNCTIHAGTTLHSQAIATDPNIPTNILSYSLDAGAPTNATINPSNGLLTWPTTIANAGTTNIFTVRVTDNGIPPLTDTKTFSVTVVSRLGIQFIAMSNDIETVTWSAIAGETYQLQYKDSIKVTNWTDAINSVTADGSTASQTVPSGSTQRFYRVKLMP